MLDMFIAEASLKKKGAGLTPGSLLYFESMLIFNRPWRDAWKLIQARIEQGDSVTFYAEGVEITGVDDPVFRALNAASDMDHAYHKALITKGTKERLSRTKDAFGVGDGKWIAPSDETLAAIRQDIESHMPITALCKKYNFSRTTYYRWEAKGLFEQSLPGGKNGHSAE